MTAGVSDPSPTIVVEIATPQALDDWAALRQFLWTSHSLDEHRREVAAWLADARCACFIAWHGREAVGFAEIALRSDYVAGCSTSPVAFLEGIYVAEQCRGRGIARLLCGEAEKWAVAQGCREFASDADIGNRAAHRMHATLGFEEVERVVFFRKAL